ncbi:MAG TPA: hypothetical protein VJJ76_03275 [archaeon]|nr:hypothetical protein [archaeon]
MIIPGLFLFYLSFLDVIVASIPAVFEQGFGGSGGGGVEVIGMGYAVSVSVTRPYLFDLIRLPVYGGPLGDISGIHTTFFAILGFLLVAFVAWDVWSLLKGKTSYTYGSKYQWRKW